MDVGVRYFAGAFHESTGMETAICALELCWFAQFWPRSARQSDMAFGNSVFVEFLMYRDIYFQPFSPRRYEKKTIKPRPRTICSIFLHLKSFDPSVPDSIKVIRAVRIPNFPIWFGQYFFVQNGKEIL